MRTPTEGNTGCHRLRRRVAEVAAGPRAALEATSEVGMRAFLEALRRRRRGVASARLDSFERVSLGHYLVCPKLRHVCLVVGDTLHEATPTIAFVGIESG